MLNIFKVVFVGAGYMAEEHLKAFKDLQEVELAGIYSRTKAKAQLLAEKYQITNVCDSIEDLFAITNANLVVISVPELSTKDVCYEAFKFPWSCLIEKPVGINLNDAEDIATKAKDLGRNAFVALNRRHYGSTRKVIDAISNEKDPILIHVYDQENPIEALHSGQPEQVVKNWMYANSIHLVDYFNTLGRGKIVKVDKVVPWNSENPSFVIARLYFDSGDIGIYEAVWNCPGPWAVTVTSHSARWEMRPLEVVLFQPYGSRKLEALPVDNWDLNFKPGLRFQAQEAVKASLGFSHNLPSLESALNSVKLISNIYSS